VKLAAARLMDIGCYCVNFSRLFAGAEPTQISVTGKFTQSALDEWQRARSPFRRSGASFACGMTACRQHRLPVRV